MNIKNKLRNMEGYRPERQKNIQNKLLQDFLNNKIDFNNFREDWFKLDQQDDHTKEAQNNILMLENQKLKEKIFNLRNEQKRVYLYMLSVSYFHKAQGTPNINDFKKAYEYAKEIKDDNYKYWEEYCAGTLAYFEKNIEKLIFIKNKMDNTDINKKNLNKFIESLINKDIPEKSYIKIMG